MAAGSSGGSEAETAPTRGEGERLRTRPPWSWTPYAGGVLALLAGVLFWRTLTSFEEAHVDEATNLAATEVAREITDHTRRLTEPLRLLGAAVGEAPTPGWKRQTALLVEQFPGLLTIDLLDVSSRPIESVSRPSVDSVPPPPRPPAMQSDESWLSEVSLIGGEPFAWLVVPAAGAQKLAALLRVDTFTTSALSAEARRFSIAVDAGSHLIFETHSPEEGATVVSRSLQIAALGAEWQLRVAASPAIVVTGRSPLWLIALGLTVVIAALVVISLRAAAAERHRSRQLAEQGRHLEAEIGERRWAEEELRALNRQLDERVQHRTTELANIVEQLAAENRVRERVQAQLERMNKNLREFDGFISHELRQPLGALQIWIELLEASPGELSEKRREYVAKAKGEIQRMAKMIENELRLSKAAHGEVPTEPVALAPLVREVATSLAPQLEPIDARVEIGELPAAFIDPDQARQIFTNLIENAIRYRRTDAPLELRIDARHEDVPAEFSEIVVRDNGQGFDTSTGERLFETFRRGTQGGVGSGLGLAICRRIVEHHGGSIRAEGTPGEGATLVIRLPVVGEA